MGEAVEESRDLTRLLLGCDQAKHAAAHDLFAPSNDWFTEGFDTTTLKHAEALRTNWADDIRTWLALPFRACPLHDRNTAQPGHSRVRFRSLQEYSGPSMRRLR
jgi:hypothetical protein